MQNVPHCFSIPSSSSTKMADRVNQLLALSAPKINPEADNAKKAMPARENKTPTAFPSRKVSSLTWPQGKRTY